MQVVSIIDLFDNMEKQLLIKRCMQFGDGELDLRLDELMVILDETEDIDIITVMIESMGRRLADIDDQLMSIYFEKGSDTQKRYIISTLAIGLTSKYMQFFASIFSKSIFASTHSISGVSK